MAYPIHQQYANLSKDAYENHQITKNGEQGITIDGHQYKILAVANDKRSGYQGTVYYDIKNNAVIVAHRGTESPNTDWKDAVTDIEMVLRNNGQAQAAVNLTKEAIKKVREIYEQDPSKPMPTLSHTGHSLGGAHAQICAHHFNHPAVTFNAYGAASLGRIPEGVGPKGGGNVTNYVKASDPVAAASPHYGKVVVLATQDEIERLDAAGYTNKSLLNKAALLTPLLVSRVGIAAAASVGTAHGIGNFTGSNSILANPDAHKLAEANKTMIDAYRSDVDAARQALGLTLSAPINSIKVPIDIYNHFNPRPAGEPAQKNLPPLTQAPGISQPQEQEGTSPFNDPFLNRYYAAVMAGNSQQADQAAIAFAQSPQGLAMAEEGKQLLAQQQAQQQPEQIQQAQQAPVMKT